MTKSERAKLREAIGLLHTEGEWDHGMLILLQLSGDIDQLELIRRWESARAVSHYDVAARPNQGFRAPAT